MNQPIEIHNHFHFGGDRDDEIVGLLHQLRRDVRGIDDKEKLLTVQTDALLAEVANDTTVDQGILTLLTGLSASLADEPAAQAAIDGVVATLAENRQALSDAITANTPVATGGEQPPVVDQPGDGDAAAQADNPDAPVT